jgi:hypothetical protein
MDKTTFPLIKDIFLCVIIGGLEMKSKEYNIGEAVPKSNSKIVVPEVKLTLLHFSDLVQTDNKH